MLYAVCFQICDLSQENVPNGYPFILIMVFTCGSSAVQKNLHSFAQCCLLKKKELISVRSRFLLSV